MKQEALKKIAAEAAVSYIKNDSVVGVGSGSTVQYFIEALASIKGKIEGTVASSKDTANKLKKIGLPVYDLNSVNQVHIYVDGADEVNHSLQCIKGGGGALTGEKIVRAVAKEFICIADESKYVKLLGRFPLAVEVIPMARSFVAREMVKLGGDPVYRTGFVSDYGNVILDVHNFEILAPAKLEQIINQIPGVVTNGLFAMHAADRLLLGTNEGVKEIKDI